MSGARFVRLYPSDWRSGCIGLTPEEEGMYMRICAHFWETGQRLPIDDHEAAARVMTDVRMYRRLKASLLKKGKLHVASDGIFNPRAERELECATAAQKQETAVDTARGTDDREHRDGRDPVEGRQPAREGLLADIGETSARLPGEVSEILSKIESDINGPLKSLTNDPYSESDNYPSNLDAAREGKFEISSLIGKAGKGPHRSVSANMRRNAEKLGLPVDELVAEALGPTIDKPSGYFRKRCVDELKLRYPLASRKTLIDAIDGDEGSLREIYQLEAA